MQLCAGEAKISQNTIGFLPEQVLSLRGQLQELLYFCGFVVQPLCQTVFVRKSLKAVVLTGEGNNPRRLRRRNGFENELLCLHGICPE